MTLLATLSDELLRCVTVDSIEKEFLEVSSMMKCSYFYFDHGFHDRKRIRFYGNFSNGEWHSWEYGAPCR